MSELQTDLTRSDLLRRAAAPDPTDGATQRLEPADAGWTYVAFAAHTLRAGQGIEHDRHAALRFVHALLGGLQGRHGLIAGLHRFIGLRAGLRGKFDGLSRLLELQRDGRARIIVCLNPKRNELADWIRARARFRKVKLDVNAVADLADFIGDDLRQIDQELHKLADYAGKERTVTRADVRQLVPATRAANIFELVDALGIGDAPTAGRLMQHALDAAHGDKRGNQIADQALLFARQVVEQLLRLGEGK